MGVARPDRLSLVELLGRLLDLLCLLPLRLLVDFFDLVLLLVLLDFIVVVSSSTSYNDALVWR